MTGKQLRNSILQWAIQGKLVPQDPNDEPASVLLERIRAEKARLIKEKKIKRDKNESIIYRGEDNSYYEKFLATGEVKCIDDEIPFEIPQGWEWARLKDIISIRSGDNLTSKQMQEGDIPVYGGNGITGFHSRANIFNETIVIGRVGFYCGSIHLTPERAWVTDNAFITEYSKLLSRDYLILLLSVMNLGKVHNATAQPVVSGKSIYPLLVPIPPKQEQSRIVSILTQVNPHITEFEIEQIKLQYLNKHIYEKLRLSILQEAIQGKLVPQIKSEGSAEELLEEIQVEKTRLVKEGKLKKTALANECRIFRGEDNKYYLKDGQETFDLEDSLFPIPKTWRWITLGELIADSTGLSYKKEDLTDRNTPQVRVLRGGNIEDGKMILKDDDVFIASKYVPQELYLKKGIFISPAVSSLEKIGKTAVISKDLENVVVGGFVLMLTPTFSDAILRQYLYQFFQSAYYHNYCKSITKKSGQAFYNLSRQKLKQCSVPIPPKSEIPRIMAQLDKALASIMSR